MTKTWWKYEIGVAWEQHRAGADPEWEDVLPWLEVHERCDVVIARPRKDIADREILDTSDLLIPLELKTTGTWWWGIDKALAPLRKDMDECVKAHHKRPAEGGRKANPFAAVALLITHVRWDDPGALKLASLDDMVRKAHQHGQEACLELVHEVPISLGRVGTGRGRSHSGDGEASAYQLVWAKRTVTS
jgi:hypothetical protein